MDVGESLPAGVISSLFSALINLLLRPPSRPSLIRLLFESRWALSRRINASFFTLPSVPAEHLRRSRRDVALRAINRRRRCLGIVSGSASAFNNDAFLMRAGERIERRSSPRPAAARSHTGSGSSSHLHFKCLQPSAAGDWKSIRTRRNTQLTSDSYCFEEKQCLNVTDLTELVSLISFILIIINIKIKIK